MTTIYFVRHAESPYIPEKEYERGLSDKGKQDAKALVSIFKDIPVDAMYSSAYQRAIDTIKYIGFDKKIEIDICENLNERIICKDNRPWSQVKRGIEQSFIDLDFHLGDESTKEAQKRSIPTLLKLINLHKDEVMIIATHGNILTIMLNYFDKEIAYDFWNSLDKPDIVKAVFKESRLIEVSCEIYKS